MIAYVGYPEELAEQDKVQEFYGDVSFFNYFYTLNVPLKLIQEL